MRNGRLPTAYGTAPGPEWLQRRLADECALSEVSERPFVLLLLQIGGGQDTAEGITPVSPGAVALVIEGLRRRVRAEDALCQLDPFSLGVLLVDCDPGTVAMVQQRLLASAEEKLTACLPQGMVPRLRTGWAVWPADGRTPSELMAAANAALRTDQRPQADVAQARASGIGRSLFRQRRTAPSERSA